MRKSFPITIIAIVATLLGFIWIILEDDIKSWGVEFFGPNYKIILTAFAVLFIFIGIVVDSYSSRKKEQSVPADSKPQPAYSSPSPIKEQASPTQRFPTRNEYEAIIAEFNEDRLTEALDLMDKVPVYRKRIPIFRRQLNQLLDAEIENMAPEIGRNEIANALIKFIQAKQPQEEYDTPAVNEATGSSQSHIIKDPDASILRVSRNFLGRDDKIAEINGLLAHADSPDIAVTGLAGNGKTTICHYIISEWLREQPGRVAYVVEVEFITSVEGLSRSLAALCGLDPDRTTQEAVLAEMAQLPGGLLYLDNLESILGDKEIHAYLKRLCGCRQLQILVSSRREVTGFTRVRLDVLSEADALELFQRNWRAQTGEAFPEDDKELLSKFITKDLGCHPLSIELAASHAATVTDFSQLVTEFRDSSTAYFTRFASSEDGRLDNLYQSLGLSVNRLKGQPEALRLLALCAVFESGLDGPMQELLIKAGVFSPSDRSLLIERNLARNTEGYFSLLPPVIRFLRSLLERKEGLLNWQQLFGDSRILMMNESVVVSSRLEGLGYFAPLAGGLPDVEEVYNTFSNIDFLNHPFLSKQILECLVLHFKSSEKNQEQASTHRILGEIKFRKGLNGQAYEEYHLANELYLKIGDEQGQANVLNNLGEIEFRKGHYSQAHKQYQLALELFRKTNDEQGQANVLKNLGDIDNIVDRHDEARKHYHQANQLYQKTGDEQGQANVLNRLGIVEFHENRFIEANKLYQQAIGLYQVTGDEQGQANVLINLGQIDLQEGRIQQAKDNFQQAEKLYTKKGSGSGRANAYHFIAHSYQKVKNVPEAIHYWQRALALYRQITANKDIAETLLHIAETNLTMKSPESETLLLLTEAEQLIEEFGFDDLREKLDRLKGEMDTPG